VFHGVGRSPRMFHVNPLRPHRPRMRTGTGRTSLESRDESGCHPPRGVATDDESSVGMHPGIATKVVPRSLLALPSPIRRHPGSRSVSRRLHRSGGPYGQLRGGARPSTCRAGFRTWEIRRSWRSIAALVRVRSTDETRYRLRLCPGVDTAGCDRGCRTAIDSRRSTRQVSGGASVASDGVAPSGAPRRSPRRCSVVRLHPVCRHRGGLAVVI
jgi:hypothetical protein